MQQADRTKQPIPFPQPSIETLTEQRTRWNREHLLQAGVLATGILYSLMTMLMWWASRDSLALTRDQVLLGQRAYLIPQQVMLVKPLAAGRPVEVSYAFKNSGSTPATEVRTLAGVWLLAKDTPILPVISNERTGAGSTVFVGAGDIKHASPRWLDDDPQRLLSADELERIQTGELKLYAIVAIDYRDVFKHPGRTVACAVYEPAVTALIECGEGNSLT